MLSAAGAFMLVAMLLVGVPASVSVWRSEGHWRVGWRNPTAIAMVGVFAFFRLTWADGIVLPLKYYVMADILVLMAIACKTESCDLSPYGGFWHRVRCKFLERSHWDQIVVAIFPLVWIAYVANISPTVQWWALWFLALMQLFAAGGEALDDHLTWRMANAPKPNPSDGTEYRWAWGRAGAG